MFDKSNLNAPRKSALAELRGSSAGVKRGPVFVAIFGVRDEKEHGSHNNRFGRGTAKIYINGQVTPGTIISSG